MSLSRAPRSIAPSASRPSAPRPLISTRSTSAVAPKERPVPQIKLGGALQQRLNPTPPPEQQQRGRFDVLGQGWDLLRAAPVGIAGLMREASETVIGPGRIVVDLGRTAMGQDTHILRALSDGLQLSDIGSITREYTPLAASMSRSMANTGYALTHPGEYRDAFNEGRIVDRIAEDVGNLALIAGPVAKALGTTSAVTGAATESAALIQARAGATGGASRTLRTTIQRGNKTTGTLGGESRSLSAATMAPERLGPAQKFMPTSGTVRVPGSGPRSVTVARDRSIPMLSDQMPGGGTPIRSGGTGLAGRLERIDNPTGAWNIEPSLRAQRVARAGEIAYKGSFYGQFVDPAEALLTVGARGASAVVRKTPFGPFMSRLEARTRPIVPGQLEMAEGAVASRVQKARTYLRNVRGAADMGDDVVKLGTEAGKAGLGPAVLVNSNLERLGFTPEQVKLYGNTVMAITDRALDSHLVQLRANLNNEALTVAQREAAATAIMDRLNADRVPSTHITREQLMALEDYNAGRLDPKVKAVIDEARHRLVTNSADKFAAGAAQGNLEADQLAVATLKSNPKRALNSLSPADRAKAIADGDVIYPQIERVVTEARTVREAELAAAEAKRAEAYEAVLPVRAQRDAIEASRTSLGRPGQDVPVEMQTRRVFSDMADERYRRDLAQSRLDRLEAAEPTNAAEAAAIADEIAIQRQVIEVLNEEIANTAEVAALTRAQITAKRRPPTAKLRSRDITDDGTWIRDAGEASQRAMHDNAVGEFDRVFGDGAPAYAELQGRREQRKATGVAHAGGEWDVVAPDSKLWTGRRDRGWYIRQGWFAKKNTGMTIDEFANMARGRDARLASMSDWDIMEVYLDTIDRIYDTRRKGHLNDRLVETIAGELGIDVEMAHAAMRGERPYRAYMRDVANDQALGIKRAFEALDTESQIAFLRDIDAIDTYDLPAADKARVFFEALEDHFDAVTEAGFDAVVERRLFEQVVDSMDANAIRRMLDRGQFDTVQLRAAENANVVRAEAITRAEGIIAELEAKAASAVHDATARRSLEQAAAGSDTPARPVRDIDPERSLREAAAGIDDAGAGIFDEVGGYVDPDAPAKPSDPMDRGTAEHAESGYLTRPEATLRPEPGRIVGTNNTPDGMHDGGTHLAPIEQRAAVVDAGAPIDGTTPPMTDAQAISVDEGRVRERLERLEADLERADGELRRARYKARNLERDLRQSLQDELRGINAWGVRKMQRVARTLTDKPLGGLVPATELSQPRLNGLVADLARKHKVYDEVLARVRRGEGRGSALDPAAVVLRDILDERRVLPSGKVIEFGLDEGRWNQSVAAAELSQALERMDSGDLMSAWAAYQDVTARMKELPEAVRRSVGYENFDQAMSDAFNETRARFNRALNVELDRNMAAIPAPIRTPITEARRGVAAQLQEAQAQWDLGTAEGRDVAMALESVVRDTVTSIEMYVNADLPIPTHLTAGTGGLAGPSVTRGRSRLARVEDTRQANARAKGFRVNTLDDYALIEAHEMTALARNAAIQHLAMDPTLSASAYDIVGDKINEHKTRYPNSTLRWKGEDGLEGMLAERGYSIIEGATTDTRNGAPANLTFREAPLAGVVDSAGNTRARAYMGDGRIIDLDDPAYQTVLPEVRVMPTRMATELADFNDPTSNSYLLMHDQTVQLWKTSTLAWSPAWVTYNAIGNALMSTFSYGLSPMQMTRGISTMREAMRRVNMDMDPAKGSKAPLRTAFSNDSMSSLVPGQLAAHGYNRAEKGLTMRAVGNRQTRLGRALDYVSNPEASWIGRGTEFMYNLNEFTDNIFRSTVMMEDLYKRLQREAPIPRNLLDANGNVRRNLTPAETAQLTDISAAARKAQDASVRAALNTMGDFTRLTRFERNVVKRFIPFWPWLRHQTAMTMRMPLTNPLRWAWMASLHETLNGDLGDGDRENYLLSMLVGAPGGGMISLRPANPFSLGLTAFGSDQETSAAFSPRALAGALSPAVKFPVEAIFGFDIDGEGTVSRPIGQREMGDFGVLGNPSSLSRIINGVASRDLTQLRGGLGELGYNALGQVAATRGLRDFGLSALEGNRVRYDSGDAIPYLEDKTDSIPRRLGAALRIPGTPGDYEYQLQVARDRDREEQRQRRLSLYQASQR